MTNDKLQQLDNKLRELRKEVEEDLLKYKDKGWLCEDLSIMNISVEKSIEISERGREKILEAYGEEDKDDKLR